MTDIKEIKVMSQDPHEMKKQLIDEAREFLDKKQAFKLEAHYSQYLSFRKEFKMGMQECLMLLVNNRVNKYTRRSLTQV
jgi:hypothetical protein